MGNKEIKSMSPMIKEMQMNVSPRYHLWSIRWAKTKKNGNAKAGKDKGRKQTLVTRWWVCKLEQPFQRTTWHSALKAVDLEIWLLGIYLKNVSTLFLILKNQRI